MDTKAIVVSVANALAHQPWFMRRKDTIITITTGIVWLTGVLVPYLGGAPTWVGVVIGAVGTIAGAMVNALTPGAITPSMAQRLSETVPPPLRDDGLDRLRAKLGTSADAN